MSPTSLAAAYAHAAREHPWVVNGGLGALAAGLGDQACQRFVEKKSISSGRRTINIALIRCFLAMPWLLFWFGVQQKLAPGTSNLAVLQRVLLDLAIGTPMMILLVFLGSSILTGQLFRDPSQLVRLFSQEFIPTYAKGAKFWPPVHFAFTYRAPVLWRPLISTIAGIYWNAVLSYGATREIKKK